MKEKRRDSKERILHTGESQRTDGKYLYKYVDAFGNTKYVYAWRLTPTDPTPKGKREKPSLRELEQQIRRDIEDGIDSTGKKMTLCQLYAKQNAQRANVKKSTQKQREQLMRLLKEDKLGARSIDTIKPSDAKEWALRMKDKGFSYNTINNHKRSLKASFYIAIQDDCVRKNPFNFKLSEFPYAAIAEPSLPSALQIAVDHGLLATNMTIILAGSNEGFMESEVLGRKSRLYGRRTAQIRLLPFDYADAAKFLPNTKSQDLVRYYATFGGTPYYLARINESDGFEDNVLRLLFDNLLANGGVMIRLRGNRPILM